MRSVALALSLVLAAGSTARADYQIISLAWVAAQNGYSFRWLGPERSVSLSRPGTEIVIRPGAVLYDVNAHVEVADAAPVATRSGDVLITAWMAGRIKALARRSSQAVSLPAGPAVETAGGAAPLRGTIVLRAQQMDDTQALAIAGQAPPGAPITITILATIASELPTVVLSRNEVQSDITGHFDAVVSVASDYMPGSLLTVVATSLPEITPASAYLKLGQPNAEFGNAHT